MKTYTTVLLFLLLFAHPVLADHWFNELLNDYEKTGSIASHHDDSDMQMTFLLNAPLWVVADGMTALFEKWTEVPLEQKSVTDETAVFVTDWKVLESGFFRSVFTGKDRRRFRLKWRAMATGPNQTTVIGSAQYQVQNENAFNDNWKDRSDREFRLLVRQLMAPIATYARYPNNFGVRARITQDYQKGARHGKDGYLLDPPQMAEKPAKPAAQATKTCPYCAETILQAAVKCKHCGEFLDRPQDSTSPSVDAVETVEGVVLE